jgi:hypothetical protein
MEHSGNALLNLSAKQFFSTGFAGFCSWTMFGSGLLTSGQEVPGSNPSVGVRHWVSLFALITSPHPGVKGVPSRQKRYLCLCSL